MKTIRRLGRGTAIGAVMAAALGGAVACGDSFGEDGGCKVSHTCEPVAGSSSNGGAEDGVEIGGQAGAPGTGNGTGGMAGADDDAECASPADCDNGDASDGVEACFNGKCLPGNVAPTIIEVTPANEASGVEPDGTIVLEASEALNEATITTANIKLLDGELVVPGKITYANKKITITPNQPLALLVPYEVRVTTAVADLEGAGLAEEFRSTFQVRDGAWSVAVVAEGGVQAFSPLLQLNAKGEALLAWVGPSETSCPTQARWYRNGEPVSPIKTLTYAYDHYCHAVRASVSPGGLAIVSWFEESESDNAVASAEFRDGKWGLPSERSTRYDYSGAVAASDTGVMHYFGTSDDVQASTTSTDGVWVESSQTLAPQPPVGDPRIATGPSGKAVAVWRVRQTDGTVQIMASRFDPESGVWSMAQALPGSASSETADRGEPQVALDTAGNAMVLWQRGTALVSTQWSAAQSAWTGWTVASGTLSGFPKHELSSGTQTEPPALVFDGQTFVAAFAAVLGKQRAVYVARYNRDEALWGEPELVSDLMTAAVARMPQITADAHGNLLVIWPTAAATSGAYGLAFQRFDAAGKAWSGPQLIPDAQLEGPEFENGWGDLAFGGNSKGYAALAFANVDPTTNLRVASFY